MLLCGNDSEKTPKNTNDMPNHKRFDPQAGEKKKLAKQIADKLELITPKERQKIAVDLECSERSITNYGSNVADLDFGNRMHDKLKLLTAGRKKAAA